MNEPGMLKSALVAEACDAGFADVKICRPDAVPEVPARLQTFLAEGRHGQMSWMERRVEWRGNPTQL